MRLAIAVAATLLALLTLQAARPSAQPARRLAARVQAAPLRLHPKNPRYFLFRGRPTVLLTAGEHYGAVVNQDFDYVRYLNAIRSYGFNLTRLFTGSFVAGSELASLGVVDSLSPPPGRLLTPWALSGTKFDLGRWNPRYFTRLRDFVRQAGVRGIVVEVVLFSAYYNDRNWHASPLYAPNNVAGVGTGGCGAAYAADGELVPAQDALARRVVTALAPFDNVYYEALNEPYYAACGPSRSACATASWQAHLISVVAAADAAQGRTHLIAQNVADGGGRAECVDPRASILNFHYATPAAVAENLPLRRAIADDETGFKGTGADAYRAEIWAFALAGGGVVNALDWTFAPGHEWGTSVLAPRTPGGGGPELRAQVGVLKRFLTRFDLLRMAPDQAVVVGGVPDGGSVRVLAERGRQYAVYVQGGGKAAPRLRLPPGVYRAQWLSPSNGAIRQTKTFRQGRGLRLLVSPPYLQDIALSVRRLAGRPG